MIKYIFGNTRLDNKDIEIVKTVGETHTNLQGFCHIEQQYADNYITDEFRVVRKYHSAETTEECYDWYEIDSHNRMMDYFTPAKPVIEQSIDDAYDATCELSETTEESIAALEQAICELSEEIYGGE